MPHTAYDDDELGLAPGWDEGLDSNIRRELRQSRVLQQEHQKLQNEVTGYRRERLFLRAGIPQDRRGDLFTRTYEGDLEDADTVRAAYEELFGPLKTSPPSADPSTAGDRRIADANAAGDQEGTPGTMELGDAMRNAKTKDEVLTIIRQAAAQNPEAGIRLPDDL